MITVVQTTRYVALAKADADLLRRECMQYGGDMYLNSHLGDELDQQMTRIYTELFELSDHTQNWADSFYMVSDD